MKSLTLALAGLLSAFSLSAAQAKAPVALFYMIETPKSEASFEAHIDKIDLLVPTWYGVDKNGMVVGAANPGILRTAKAHKLPIMPIISVVGDRPVFHALLGNVEAQDHMIARMIEEAKQQGYVGFQFDFENIAWTDKDAFTRLTKRTADALHAQGLQLSVAVCPNAPGHPGRGAFSKWMFEYWRGAYDIKALGESVDFISWMTYDQNTRWTPPGPVDGMPWLMENLEFALKVVPKDKISLGIALYGYHWYADNPVKADGTEAPNIGGAYIDADEWQPMAKQYDAKLQWDPVDHETFFYFYRDDMREWAFVPDAHSFRDRYAVAKQYGLLGFSSWVLGAEDPKVWDELPVAKR